MLTSALTTLMTVVTAVLTYGNYRKSHALSTQDSDRGDRRGRSEETMRLLRWAVDLATDPDARRRLAGVSVLDALTRARIVVRGDRAFIQTVARAVMAGSVETSSYSLEGDMHVDAENGGSGHV